MNSSQIRLIQQINKMTTQDIKLMINEYDRLFMKTPLDKTIGLHLIKRMKIRKGWKKVTREQRRFAYKQLHFELFSRKEK